MESALASATALRRDGLQKASQEFAAILRRHTLVVGDAGVRPSVGGTPTSSLGRVKIDMHNARCTVHNEFDFMHNHVSLDT